MTKITNLLYPKSTNGWETSVVGKELVDDIFNDGFTKPSFKTISLRVKQECQIELILGANNIKEVLTIMPETGLEIDSRFHYVYSFKFLTPDVPYYALLSY